MVYLSISCKVKHYTKQITICEYDLAESGQNDSEKGQLNDENKIEKLCEF